MTTIPPAPTYERNLDTLEQVYKDALQQVIQLLQSVPPEDLVQQELLQSQLRQLTYLISQLTTEAQQWVETTLTESFTEGQAMALVSMGLAQSLVEAKGMVTFSLMSRNRIEAMIDSTFEELLQAHSKMEKNLKEMVRETVAEVMRTNTAIQRGTITSAQDIRKALASQGFSKSLIEEEWKGIVDASGRRWDLTTYSKMVARSKLQQVQAEGARIQALENDNDLAIISSHGAKDSCRHFEGMIISLEGKTKGYVTYEQLRASQLIFHPNCQHSVHPIGDIDALPPQLKEKAKKAEATALHALENRDNILKEDNARRYKEKKERQEKIKAQRKKALEKARKALKEKRKR
jgi:hypothetical protein